MGRISGRRLRRWDLTYSGGIVFRRNTDHSSIMARGGQEYSGTNVGTDRFLLLGRTGKQVHLLSLRRGKEI